MDQDDEFADQLKCPICFEIPENEVFQCRNGHTICNKCSDCMEDCPQCRLPFKDDNKIRVRALESLLDTMRFECINRDFGCPEKLKRKEMASHAEMCIFNRKPFHFCKLIGHSLCNYSLNTFSISAAIRHLKNEHGVIICNGDRVDICQENYIDATTNHSEKSNVWTPILLNLEKDYGPSFVILSITNSDDDNTASWICLYLGESSYEANEFVVEFCIQNNRLEEDIPELKWKVSPIALDQAKMMLKMCPYRIPIPSLAKYYAVNGSLSIKVTLTRRFMELEQCEKDPAITKKKSLATASALNPVSIFHTPINKGAGSGQFATLRQESSSLREVSIFHDVTCDHCRRKPLSKIRYTCLQCPNYDLCKNCKDNGIHSQHIFAALTNPSQYGFIAELMKKQAEINQGVSRRTIETIAPDCSPLPDGVTCNGCCVVPISGTRYKCLQCLDFNLCLPCMVHKIHSRHVLVMIQNIGQNDFVQRLARIRSPIINDPNEIDELGVTGNTAMTHKTPGPDPNQVSFLGVICDGCRIVRIVDTLYLCLQCSDYNLCTTCGLRGTHSGHSFAVISSRRQLDFIKRSWSLTEF